MSKRNKLQKFEEMAFFKNVRECPDPTIPQLFHEHKISENLKGNWANKFFQNNNPIVLELACGKGEYTVEMGKTNKEINYIGLDVKGARIWRGALTALEEDISNVGFLRTKIEVLDHFFDKNEVAEIWITFPDPFRKKINRRLTAKIFLDKYLNILQQDGILHLKHDDDEFFEYSIEYITEHPAFEISHIDKDIYSGDLYLPELGIKTFYEKQHLSKKRTIKYLQARLILNSP